LLLCKAWFYVSTPHCVPIEAVDAQFGSKGHAHSALRTIVHCRAQVLNLQANMASVQQQITQWQLKLKALDSTHRQTEEDLQRTLQGLQTQSAQLQAEVASLSQQLSVDKKVRRNCTYSTPWCCTASAWAAHAHTEA
jgi:paraquat-inducible protein B